MNTNFAQQPLRCPANQWQLARFEATQDGASLKQ